MNIKSLVSLVLLLIFVTGCTAPGPKYRYAQPSPEAKIIPASGYTKYTNNVEGSLRYDPYANLAASLSQIGPMVIIVTFDYKLPYRNKPEQVSKCKLFIKPANTALSYESKCRIEIAGYQTMISFTHKVLGKRHFDLHALKGGRYDGYAPMSQERSYIAFRPHNAKTKTRLRFVYIGEDPFI